MIHLWRAVDTRAGGAGLARFARSLFAVVPNSARAERFFSCMGIIQNKLCNRLGTEKARKLVLVKADIDRVYGNGRNEQHRQFGEEVDAFGLERTGSTASNLPPSADQVNALMQQFQPARLHH